MKDRLIVALDFNTIAEAKRFIDKTSDLVGFYKVGSVLFTKAGPQIVRFLKRRGAKVFLDLKFHDIPSVVAGAAQVCTLLGVDMFNLHLLTGFQTLEQTLKGVLGIAAKRGLKKPLILGVTILTSMSEASFKDIFGTTYSLAEKVILLARLAKSAGLDGVIASPFEIEEIKRACGEDFTVVCPGIRPKDERAYDQARFMTPKEAIERGADYIVVGRPIIRAKEPREIIKRIQEELSL